LGLADDGERLVSVHGRVRAVALLREIEEAPGLGFRFLELPGEGQTRREHRRTACFFVVKPELGSGVTRFGESCADVRA